MKRLKSHSYIILIFIFSFIIIDFFRRFIICNFLKIDSNLIGYVNYVVYILLFFTILFKLKYKMYELKVLYGFIFIQILFFINFRVNGYGIDRYFYEEVFVLLPLLLIGIKLNKFDFKKVYFLVLKLINILVGILVFLGVIDFITNSGVQKFLASHNYFESLLNSDLLMQSGVYRYYSFYGHPLRVAQMIILFYILNAIAYQYLNKKINMFIISIVSIVGVIITSSKAGIIILLALLIINFNIYKSIIGKICINTFLVITVVSVALSKVFREIVLARLVNIDFSSGRNEVFDYIKMGYLPKPTFLGKGVDYSGYLLNIMNTSISSFEYPFLIFSYECGIIITIVMYALFLYPAIKLFLKKHFKIFIYFIALTGIINIYNGISVMGDYMIQYCFIIMLFNNLNNYLGEKNEEKNIIRD
ncbi:hypothetical protein [Clostridium sp. LIBA-8841]|uniref:hypothetical protein n=1 Tax=Clostridium sp. LIBA-8841 TaxID=2987530 RepID=UPI002AC7BD7C|nr:hypothetical protein [Clostridium sp. LIBA-8841]MDZ5254358.1 hypothetical protein [Clostridium sp. LIBA-8841]